MDVTEQVERHRDELRALRRDFHRHPELGLQEFRTRDKITAYLRQLGLEVQHVHRTGVAALLRGAAAGPTLLMRADMDALPLDEQSGVSYASENKGVMHACGHDAHMAMLLVAAKILTALKARLAGNVKFVFEPNEEAAGALALIEAGVMEDPPVDACVAAHVWSPLGIGRIGLSAGPVMAGMKHFELVIKGRAGHTAEPQSAVDPVLAASAVVQGVQLIQSRELDALSEPAVFMFGTIRGGTAANIIPEQVVLTGTMRFMKAGSEDDPGHPRRRFERVVENICRAHRARFELLYPCSQPTLVNDPQMVDCLRAALRQFGAEPPAAVPVVTMAGEDFAEFSVRKPSVFFFLGAGNDQKGIVFGHHHPRFAIDEDVLPLGVEIFVRTALQYCRAR